MGTEPKGTQNRLPHDEAWARAGAPLPPPDWGELDPEKEGVPVSPGPRPTNMRGALEHVRRAGREEAAQIADLVARRRALAGDEAGAGVAQDIARFIRQDEGMGEG